jgi:putative serine protease PepD
VVIGSDGLILTSAHVVRNAIDIRVVLSDGSWHPVAGVVVDERLDVAVLRINATGLRALPPTRLTASAGTPIVAIGWSTPRGAASARSGVVTSMSSSLQAELDPTQLRDYSQLIESTAELEPGFSGGPMVDTDGELIGLNVAISGARATRRAYTIPFTEQACEVVARLAEKMSASKDGSSKLRS